MKNKNRASTVVVLGNNSDTNSVNKNKHLISRKQILSNLLIIAAISFGVSILSASIWKTAMNKVNEKNTLVLYQQNPENQEVELNSVDYFLVHPGILPGNPLYLAKMGRDRISLWLTFGPQAQAQKLLLYADKRIASAQILVNKGQLEGAIGLAFKAEEYAYQAADRLPKTSDNSISSLKETMIRSNLKHKEILTEINLQLGTQIPDNFRAALDYNQRINRLLQNN